APPNQNYTASGTEMWLGSRSGDVKNAHHTGIDLMHG
ncbi:hypothetical protein A2U01_0035398, partial [Trifolium medium]|nr:hypothetical protein [Trifolium medium]